MIRFPTLVAILTISLLTATLIGCQSRAQTSTPDLTVPGKSHLRAHAFDFETPVTIKAGETGIANLKLETRKDGPGEVTYSVYRVANEYSKEKLPNIENLKLSIEPSKFMAYPEMLYNSRLLIKTSSELATGEYYLMVEFHFENISGGRGWIKVNVGE